MSFFVSKEIENDINLMDFEDEIFIYFKNKKTLKISFIEKIFKNKITFAISKNNFQDTILYDILANKQEKYFLNLNSKKIELEFFSYKRKNKNNYKQIVFKIKEVIDV